MKRHLFCAVSLCTVACGSGAFAEETKDDSPTVAGVIRQVTLYRDRALVTREITVTQGANLRAIEVPNLPELVLPESVYAEGDQQTTVRAVRISTRPVAESQRAEVRELDQQIEKLKLQRDEAQQQLEVANANLESLNQMVSFSVTAGQSDLNRGVLNAKTLTELNTYSMTQRRELASEQHRLKQSIDEIDEQLGFVNLKRNQATNNQQAANYQAKIFVETVAGKAGKVRLNYLVGGCGWLPQYSVRGRIGDNHVELQYSALVSQMSGENWPQVRLVLSTASPSISSARPTLTPLRIESVSPSELPGHAKLSRKTGDPFSDDVPALRNDGASDRLSAMIQSLRGQQREVETMLERSQYGVAPAERDVALNSLAGKMQQIELQAEAKSWRTVAPDVKNEVASQVYRLAQPVSLDTRREQQLVQILETRLEGEMYHVATPLLSSFAYREALVTNTEPIGLLSGPASIYLDDRFVGRTEIPSTASGQRLTIGLGADQQVRTRRELLDKKDSLQGGNRQLTFAYRLVLANFKDQPVDIRLIDRMPITRQAQQLSVQLSTPTLPLSEDGLYQRVMLPTGILRWDLTVPAGRHGSKAFDVNYSYMLEFDRSRMPTTQHRLSDITAEYRNQLLPGAGMGGMGGFGGMGGGK